MDSCRNSGNNGSEGKSRGGGGEVDGYNGSNGYRVDQIFQLSYCLKNDISCCSC